MFASDFGIDEFVAMIDPDRFSEVSRLFCSSESNIIGNRKYPQYVPPRNVPTINAVNNNTLLVSLIFDPQTFVYWNLVTAIWTCALKLLFTCIVPFMITMPAF